MMTESNNEYMPSIAENSSVDNGSSLLDLKDNSNNFQFMKRKENFALVHEAISNLQKSDIDGYCLDQHIGDRGKKILLFLEDHSQIWPPKLIIEDEKEITFTWVRDNFKFYLSIDEEGIDLLTIDMVSEATKSDTISNIADTNIDKFLPYFNDYINTHTSEESHSNTTPFD